MIMKKQTVSDFLDRFEPKQVERMQECAKLPKFDYSKQGEKTEEGRTIDHVTTLRDGREITFVNLFD